MASQKASTRPSSWDLLPCNSYLISLLPVEEALRFLPGGLASQTEVHDFLRFLAAAWLMWSQQTHNITSNDRTPPVSSSLQTLKQGILRDRQQGVLLALFAMDGAPIVYRFVVKQMERLKLYSMPSEEHQVLGSLSSLAVQRRQQLWKMLTSAWPLIRLALWMQLVVAGGGEDGTELAHRNASPAVPLYAVYAHRRWLHEQGMEFWQTAIRPLLESSRDTRRWMHQLWR
jgi:hypothetical protein